MGEMEKRGPVTPNQAAAAAAGLALSQVISAAHSPQQDELLRLIALQETNRGGGRFIEAESGRSAIAIAAGAAQAGGRTFAALSADGLAGAQDVLFWAAQARLPLVLALACGAMPPASGTRGDITAAAAQRDTGWVILHAATCQEIVDMIIVGRKVAEKVSLPVMVCYDAHPADQETEEISLPDKKGASRFIGEARCNFSKDAVEPRAFAPHVGPEYQMEFHNKVSTAHREAGKAFADISKEYSRTFGLECNPVEHTGAQDAQTIVVASGRIATVAREAISGLSQKGEPAALIKTNVLSPAPLAEIRDALGNRRGNKTSRRLVVIDDNLGHGAGGALARETKTGLSGMKDPPLVIAVYAGLGGRDVTAADVTLACSRAREADENTGPIWIGLRE